MNNTPALVEIRGSAPGMRPALREAIAQAISTIKARCVIITRKVGEKSICRTRW